VAVSAPAPSLAALEHAAAGGDDGARIELARRLLLEHEPDQPDHCRGLALLEQATGGARGRDARWLLAAYHLMALDRPGALAQVRHWLPAAAASGHAGAIDRLADLHLQGLALPASPAQALALHRQLAERGSGAAAWQAGYLLDQWPALDDDPAAALTAFARGCALGHPACQYALGLRLAQPGRPPVERALARALLLRAADARWPDARDAAQALVPAGSTGADEPTWYGRLRAAHERAAPTLRGLAAGVAAGLPAPLPALEAQLAAIGHPALALDGERRLRVRVAALAPAQPPPPAWDWLSQRPRVAVCRNFASREECAHLMAKVAPWLADARAYHGRASANDDAELEKFNGQGSPIGAINADAVVRRLEQRIAALTGWPQAALEPCSIIRYRPGEEYRPHVDYFTDDQIERNRDQRGDASGQRVATFLLYLQAPQAGGQTDYPRAGLRVGGVPGMGVIHYNVGADGRPDPDSLHCGRPVERGEKWLWRCTLRERALAPWQSP
jgi:prolyl 4-hydroxylase